MLIVLLNSSASFFQPDKYIKLNFFKLHTTQITKILHQTKQYFSLSKKTTILVFCGEKRTTKNAANICFFSASGSGTWWDGGSCPWIPGEPQSYRKDSKRQRDVGARGGGREPQRHCSGLQHGRAWTCGTSSDQHKKPDQWVSASVDII